MAEDYEYWTVNASGTDDFVVSREVARRVIKAMVERDSFVDFVDHAGLECTLRPQAVNAVYQSTTAGRNVIREHNHIIKKEDHAFKVLYGWELADDE